MARSSPGPRPSPDSAASPGSAESLETLFREYAPKVYGLARRCGLDATEAEDGVQEVFLKVQRRIDTFRGEARLSTWLYQVALRTLLDHRRRVMRHRRDGRFPGLTEGRAENEIPDGGPSPGAEASRLERQGLVRACLDRLPHKYREVLILRELEGLPYRDIARILDTVQGTVESRIFRARQRLAKELAKMEGNL